MSSSASASSSVRTDRGTADSTVHRRRLTPSGRRSELIGAALRVLRTESDERNWVAAVTREAGAAKGTFYLYFPSWEDMLAVIRERLINRCGAPLRDALAATEPVDWWAVLDQACGQFIDVAVEYRQHHDLIFHSALPGGPGTTSRSGATLLAAAIERGAADGWFASADMEAQARLLFAAIHAGADEVLAGGERRRWISACLALARGVLTKPGSESKTLLRPAQGVPQP